MLDQILAKLTKPSWLSTEFIVTLVTTVVSQLVALGWIDTTSSAKVQAHVQAYAQLAVFVIAAAYALSRGIAKHGLAGTLKDLLLAGQTADGTYNVTSLGQDPTATAVAQQAGYSYVDPTPGHSLPGDPVQTPEPGHASSL